MNDTPILQYIRAIDLTVAERVMLADEFAKLQHIGELGPEADPETLFAEWARANATVNYIGEILKAKVNAAAMKISGL